MLGKHYAGMQSSLPAGRVTNKEPVANLIYILEVTTTGKVQVVRTTS